MGETATVGSVISGTVMMTCAGHRPMARRLVAMAGLCSALGLTGCAHSDLKAPCEASEGALSYAEMAHDCGPMRPVNAPFDALDQGRIRKTEPLR